MFLMQGAHPVGGCILFPIRKLYRTKSELNSVEGYVYRAQGHTFSMYLIVRFCVFGLKCRNLASWLVVVVDFICKKLRRWSCCSAWCWEQKLFNAA